MATKPQTYPEKIQALKTENEQLKSDLQDANEVIAARDNMLEELAMLRGKVAELSREDRQESVASKAQFTDLQQRAESAEKTAQALRQENAQLEVTISQLDSQLDLLGKERFKAQDLDRKNQTLAEELKTANHRVLSLSNLVRENETNSAAALERASHEVNALRAINNRFAEQLSTQTAEAEDRVRKLTEHIAKQEAAIDRLNSVNLINASENARLKKILANINAALDSE